MNGGLRLVAELRGERTVLTEVFRSPPFVVGQPSYRTHEQRAEVIVQQASPGLFPGDQQSIDITVAAGARLLVRAQSATKLYPCPDGESSRVCARYAVEAGGELIVLPGELIPFQDSDCTQSTEVTLATGTRFAIGEIVTPGRIAMGEGNLYRRLDLRLTIRREERPMLIDRTLIEPRVRTPQRLGIAGTFPCTGLLYLVGYNDLRFDEITEQPDVLWSSGTTGELTTIRMLSRRAADILTLRDEIVRTALNPSRS